MIKEATKACFYASDMSEIIKNYGVHTLDDLLNCTAADWSRIAQGTMLRGRSNGELMLRVWTAVASLGRTLTRLKTEGKPVPIELSRIGACLLLLRAV